MSGEEWTCEDVEGTCIGGKVGERVTGGVWEQDVEGVCGEEGGRSTE